eukprot:CAMPEP_0184014618 /NCGR_PEP_ID=MMETSP0954-20121128/5785_1 /TAXON_ID=627963 /ORGANISM="Aplanochytrium sp, Strain PBS07" /LENGTH=221 /DNA_ID=CAMNT_0026295171 /DNA_START=53 /DNA_END=715 /DNA_ORIENTATION=-
MAVAPGFKMSAIRKVLLLLLISSPIISVLVLVLSINALDSRGNSFTREHYLDSKNKVRTPFDYERNHFSLDNLAPYRGHCKQARHDNVEDVHRLQWKNVGSVSPFLFRNPRTGKQAIICLVPKGGSTTFKQLFSKAMQLKSRRTKKSRGKRSSSPFVNAYSTFSAEDFNDAYRNPEVKRFIIVRDPYVRFLSAYRDKIVENKVKRFFPVDFKDGTFTDFTE